MKKLTLILITIISLILIIFFGWYLFLRNPDIPVAETVRNILPFGSAPTPSGAGVPTSDPAGASEESPSLDEFGSPAAKLFRVSREPVAGAAVLSRGTSTVARYVDRATGHIYDVDLTTLEKTKVTNQTLPKIYEAYFRPDGNAVLLRSLRNDSDVVENLSLALTPPQTAGALYTVSSTLLRGDISAVAVGPVNTLFYAQRDTSSIVSSAFNGSGARVLFTSAFSNWRLAVAGNSLVLYTKASARAPGYAYTLNTISGTLAKILGPLNGLIATPSVSGNRVLYSHVETGRTKLFVKNLQNNTVSEILPATLAEKCVWSARNSEKIFCGSPSSEIGPNEPDNWYRGTTNFRDEVWSFDTNTNTAQILIEPTRILGIDIDVAEPRLSSNEDYLIFTNRADLSLWALRLESF